ncbi:hypothetical protein Sru01_46660 [Sphaerisporangium rufum]|uniref:Uncharacterized protein n=1 Tax=Sphaerisporangium rufum TaxID=1381558 RepID=A0A919R529_9ACTN|nr:hypothetical protein [Sphaerisporangium rufum]GII79684.1 hypothetical protein Sru01_46660 [Sphaerisporangium rufum]
MAAPLRRLADAVVALAIGAAAVYAHTLTLGADELDAPLTSRAEVGATAVTGRFSARLGKVVAARSVRLGDGPDARSLRAGEGEVFVVATVAATAPREPVWLREAWLRTRDGLDYAASDRTGVARGIGRPAQPGWWTERLFVFEVPPEALPGAELVITGPSGNGLYDEIYPGRYDQLRPEAALELTAGDAAATRLLAEVKDSWPLTG